MIAALAKRGTQWNNYKKCIEDIPKRKFKVGDKVKIKDGISSKSHGGVYPYFEDFLDQYKVMTVKKYITTDIGEYITTSEAKRGDHHFGFAEDWLEPWSDELKKGDLAIFRDNGKSYAIVRFYDRKGHKCTDALFDKTQLDMTTIDDLKEEVKDTRQDKPIRIPYFNI